jgi:putative hydrolase
MRLLADLHTHTVASGHAFSTVTELAHAAASKGLELIAFTDHGPSVPGGAHPWYFWNSKVVPSVIDGVIVLRGCEANVADTDNGIDLPDAVLKKVYFQNALRITGGLPQEGWPK